MENFRATHVHSLDSYLDLYFAGGEAQLFFYPKPSEVDDDSDQRKNLRRLQVAEVVLDQVADLTGFKMVFKVSGWVGR